ncbi:hypothetical protein EVAR_43874_1 [Eumeta japonica]|uniref:Uncharacterized protein n=1 Tax=Eumeta variegata TaxID=151549 RepID=A0A4C1WNU8_EUMVA|nr:hypothetical protein EVAR_43874_1 [Eumeta japonica]
MWCRKGLPSAFYMGGLLYYEDLGVQVHETCLGLYAPGARASGTGIGEPLARARAGARRVPSTVNDKLCNKHTARLGDGRRPMVALRCEGALTKIIHSIFGQCTRRRRGRDGDGVSERRARRSGTADIRVSPAGEIRGYQRHGCDHTDGVKNLS